MAIDPNELANAPKITLGRKEFPIPNMGARQIPKLVGLFNRSRNIAEEPSEAEIQVLYDIVYLAVTRGSPTLSRDEFDDLPISILDINLAMPVIVASCGLDAAAGGSVGG